MSAHSVKYLVVGGGIAAAGCVKQLRDEGVDGSSILLATREPNLPYHRPPLSKEYMRGEQGMEDVLFEGGAEWFESQGVDVRTETEVVALDTDERIATLADQSQVKFEKALLATGSKVRQLDVPGADLEGVLYLRTLQDCNAIKEELERVEKIALVGGSFIATELSASFTALGKKCELIMLETEPLERFFGSEVGRYFGDVLRSHGIKLHGPQEVELIEGSDGRASRVVTKSGLEVECDLVVIGAGVIPDIELAKRAGLKTARGVVADKYLETSASGIYVAGDIAEYDSSIHKQAMRIEHWDVAINQGITAAKNMLGKQEPYLTVPYFWSDLADWSSMETVGPALKWDEIWWRGSLADKKFTAWYIHKNRLVGALSVGRSDDIEVAKRLQENGTDLTGKRAQVEDPSNNSL